MKKIFLILFLLGNSAFAHTKVESVLPPANVTVAAPSRVQLTFSENVDLHFCTFKVYPLPLKGGPVTLNHAASTLAQTALEIKGDAAKRVDTNPKFTGLAAQASIPLKPELKAGNYVVMWRLLSDDGHIVTGQSVFTVQ